MRLLSLVVRGAGDPATLASAVRKEILAVDPDQAIADARTMDELVSDALLIRRLSVWMLGAFASLAMGLAAVGIYGLTAHSISRRTHEIGLLMALGASRADVLRLVVWRGVAASLIGVAIGLPSAYLLSRAMRGLLFGVAATDPLTFVLAPVASVSAAALSSYLPARRALRIDPIVALRYE